MNLIHGFELLRDEQIPELNTRARLYRHQKTGAELLSMENDDENKVFGIAFRTPAYDSTGIAHIMEHSVLCGSRKYPVKEPFVELLKGSLNTFLNAMTFPDKTVYPVASQNLKDFYNLIDVYLDAVFYPLIPLHTLQQEGWHYELEQPDGQMSFKGVVFNEMKGVYSSPDSLLDQYSQEAVFPDSPYGQDYGGDPAFIPDLTYEQFKRFHEFYYHPSNARIFFWGDDDPGERLRYINAWLSDFERIHVDSNIPPQPRFDAPRRLEQAYDPGEEGDQAKSLVAVNWMLAEAGDPELTIALYTLQQLLIGTPASPLRKALIESGLGEDLTGRGLDSGLLQMMFSTGLKGVKPEDTDAVEKLVLDTLQQLAEGGIDPQDIAAALNTVEFNLREQNTGAYPRGLVNMINALETWLYEKDPLALLAFEKPLQALKDRLARGEPVFETLIRDHFLNNPHRAVVVLHPDPKVGKEREAAEQARLEKARQSMTPEQLEQAVRDTLELRRLQETPDAPEALAALPVLSRSDLDPKIKTIPHEENDVPGGARLWHHDLFTNGILYLDLGFDLQNLPAKYLPYLPVFSRALLETGTEKESFVQLLQRIGARTGGIYPVTFTSAVHEGEQTAAWLFLRGKAMVPQAGELLDILREVITTARIDDRERIRQIVLEEKAGMESALVHAGHRFVNARLRSRFNRADWASEQMGGVEQLFFLRKLVERIDSDWDSVRQALVTLRSLLFHQSGALANVTVDGQNWSKVRPALERFLGELPRRTVPAALWEFSAPAGHEALTLPAQINFVGKAADLYRAGYRLHGSALVIVPYLRSTYLWDKIRVQGGAYGAFSAFDRNSGVFSFLSYRDPNLLNTLKVYDQTAHYLQNLDLSESELTKAIIGAIGDLDQYQLPDAKGYTAMVRRLTGLTDEERQRLRDEVLGTTVDDFHAFGDALEAAMDESVVVVLGSPAEVSQANQQLDEPLAVQKVL